MFVLFWKTATLKHGAYDTHYRVIDTDNENLMTEEVKKIRTEAGDLYFAHDFLYFKTEKAIKIPRIDLNKNR